MTNPDPFAATRPYPPSVRTYSSKEVAQLTGASLRQLQWWDEHSYVTPRRIRHYRRYTAAELGHVNLMKRLLDQQTPYAAIRRTLDHLRSRNSYAGLPCGFLMIAANSDKVAFCQASGAYWALTQAAHMSPVIVISYAPPPRTV